MLHKETQTSNHRLVGGSGNTQGAELENEAEQENEAEINQDCCRTACSGVAVDCNNTAVNNAKIEQENDATQGNTNSQSQNGVVVTHKLQN